MILNNRKLKLVEIDDTLKMSKERISHIVYENSGIPKLCAKWKVQSSDSPCHKSM